MCLLRWMLPLAFFMSFVVNNKLKKIQRATNSNKDPVIVEKHYQLIGNINDLSSRFWKKTFQIVLQGFFTTYKILLLVCWRLWFFSV